MSVQGFLFRKILIFSRIFKSAKTLMDNWVPWLEKILLKNWAESARTIRSRSWLYVIMFLVIKLVSWFFE